MTKSGYDRVVRALDNLRSATPPVLGYASTPIGPDARVDEVTLAKDSHGILHVLISPPAHVERFDLPLGEVLPARWVSRSGSPDVSFLDVTCSDPRLVSTFASLVSELLDRVDASGQYAIDELREVLDSWRSIFARASRPASKSQLIGLFGELTVLHRIAQSDPQRAMRAWRGKQGYRHDFHLANALEVKSYSTLNTPSVTIHGSYQLDPPTNAHLHLATFRVEEDAGGLTVGDLVDQIVACGVSRTELLSRSTEEAPLDLDNDLRLRIAEERLYVVGPDFPGIRASRLRPQDLLGVANLQFKLLLDACPGRLDKQDFETVVSQL